MDAYEGLRAQIEAHIETHGVEEDRLRAEIDALRTRTAQAEADARLMLHELVALDESEGTNVVGYWRGLGLTDAECGALEAAGGRTAAVPDEDLVAALRRILAAGGATLQRKAPACW